MATKTPATHHRKAHTLAKPAGQLTASELATLHTHTRKHYKAATHTQESQVAQILEPAPDDMEAVTIEPQ